MANDTFIYDIRIAAVQNLIDKMPRNCPSRRECDIQNTKLRRMVAEFRKKYTFSQATKLLIPGAKVRKKIGEEIHCLEQQSKTVRKLLDKGFEEDYFTNYTTTQTRREFRLAIAKANRHFDRKIFEGAQELRKTIIAAVNERLRELK
jgi:hypothetical protein